MKNFPHESSFPIEKITLSNNDDVFVVLVMVTMSR
jgi:hypothetical protein